MRWTRVLIALLLLTAVANSHGCQMFPHWMNPSQLWKLNRQPAYDESQFSVSDPDSPPIVRDATPGASGTDDSF